MASVSPLQLNHFVVHGLVVETNASCDADSSFPAQDDVVYVCKMDCNFGIQKKKRLYRARVRLTFERPHEIVAPYDRVQVDVEGFFSLPEDTPDDAVGSFVPKLLAVNVIGIARGVVSQSTAFCPEGPFIIPLLDVSKDFSVETKVVRSKSGSKALSRQTKQPSGKH